MDNASDLIRDTPVVASERERIEMTVRCRDCDSIPKVDRAGEVLDDDGRLVQIMHNGIRVVAGGYYGSWMTEVIHRLRGHHEPQEELVFHEILKSIHPSGVMLELGGYWSYYSLWFLNEHAATRRAFVIEPDPGHLEIGRANADLNGRSITFARGSVGGVSLPPQPFTTETAGVVDTMQIAVHDFLVEHGIGALEILHCDAQGAEIEVVRSCDTLLRERRIRFCVLSTHSHHISGDPLTHQRCLAMLQDCGGQILAEHDVHESFSGDGLIVAYFGNDPIDWAEPPMSRNRYSTSLYRNPLYDLAALLKSE